jgi:hypothetical protein
MMNFAPNTIKESLLQTGFAHAALVLDALSASGAKEWQICTISDTIKWFYLQGIDMSASLLRKGIKQLIGLGILGTKIVLSKKRGRPFLAYILPSFEAIASQLGLKLHHSENHHGVALEAFVSIRAYRAGLHRSYLMVNQNKLIARSFLGERLGVKKRTTYNYEQGTDIIAQEQIEIRQLDTVGILKLPTVKTSSKFFLISEYERPMTEEEKDIAFAWVSPEARKSFHPMKRVTQKLPLIRYLALREERLGRKVYLAWQTANSYKIDSN